MTSEKQIAANRRNAQKSTGPKTSQGKAVASKNATTHGLTANTPVLPGLPTPAQFKRMTTPFPVRMFKKYTRPVNLLKNYLCLKIKSFNRYLDIHRRKHDPVLTTPPLNLNRLKHQLLPSASCPLVTKAKGLFTSNHKICVIGGHQKTQNKPIFKTSQTTVSTYILKPQDSSLKPVTEKNKPKQTQSPVIRGSPNSSQRVTERFCYQKRFL